MKYVKRSLFAFFVFFVFFLGFFIICEMDTKAASSNVSLKKKSVTLKITQMDKKISYGTSTIQVKKKKGVSIKKVTYKVANKKVAKVSKKGKVTAKKKGKTKVTVTVKYKKKGKLYPIEWTR